MIPVYSVMTRFRRIPGDGCHHGDADRFLKFSQAPCVDHIQSNTPNAGGYDTDRVSQVFYCTSLLPVVAFFVLPMLGFCTCLAWVLMYRTG